MELELQDWELGEFCLQHKRCKYAKIIRDYNNRGNFPCYTFKYYEPKLFNKPIRFEYTFTDEQDAIKIDNYVSKLERIEETKLLMYIQRKLR